MSLRTEYPFTLPKGYVDQHGTLHRDGVMRLATARDEIDPLRDHRVQENEAYLTVILLARVVTQLGSVHQVTPKTIEELFVADLSYLQDFYRIVNFGDPSVLQSNEPVTAERGETAAAESVWATGTGSRPLEAAVAGAA
jgi:hypothetical protein